MSQHCVRRSLWPASVLPSARQCRSCPWPHGPGFATHCRLAPRPMQCSIIPALSLNSACRHRSLDLCRKRGTLLCTSNARRHSHYRNGRMILKSKPSWSSSRSDSDSPWQRVPSFVLLEVLLREGSRHAILDEAEDP